MSIFIKFISSGFVNGDSFTKRNKTAFLKDTTLSLINPLFPCIILSTSSSSVGMLCFWLSAVVGDQNDKAGKLPHQGTSSFLVI